MNKVKESFGDGWQGFTTERKQQHSFLMFFVLLLFNHDYYRLFMKWNLSLVAVYSYTHVFNLEPFTYTLLMCICYSGRIDSVYSSVASPSPPTAS